jgi:hypothetical protein
VQESDAGVVPMSHSRSAFSRLGWLAVAALAVAAAKRLLSVAAWLLRALQKRVEPNLGAVAKKTCFAVATFAVICLLSYNFDFSSLQTTLNQSTYFTAIATAYIVIMIVFCSIKSRATLSYLAALVLC